MSPPPTMRACVLTGHGGLDKLELREDVPVPVPADDEVLIAVSACGMNNTDVNTRTGWYGSDDGDSAAGPDGGWGGEVTFPRIQGADPVGRIAAVGADVDATRIGERVLVDGWLRDPAGLPGARYLGSEVDGGFAEYVVVPARNAYPVVSDLSDIELASFPCSYATAEHMLHRAGVRDGQWVLVTGASGGVGGALVQLTRRRGARVVAVTSATKVEAVRALGADVVLDRDAGDLAAAVVGATRGGVDVFADVVGGPSFAPLLGTVRRGGHYAVAGAVAGPLVDLDLRVLYLRDLTFHGTTVLPQEVFANLVGYVERGEVRPIVAATYPLARLVDAQLAFMDRSHTGAIVVDVAGTA